MLSNLSFTGLQVFIGLIVIVTLGVISLLIGRRLLKKHSAKELKDIHRKDSVFNKIKNRTKYPEVDVFSFGGTFWELGLVMTLALAVVGFNWTIIEEQVVIPDGAMELDFDLEMETPPATVAPPPPPPPPPPVIEEVPDDVILEDDDDVFADQSVDANTVVYDAPAVITATDNAPPPPPPPPPPALEVKEIFKVVEEMPRFPGCEDLGSSEEKKKCAQAELLKFVYANIKYPPMARENNVTGTVVVRFVVDEKGMVGQEEIIRDIGAGCGDEALRIIRLMREMPERWTPGKQRGRNVRVYFTFPVKFKLLTGS